MCCGPFTAPQDAAESITIPLDTSLSDAERQFILALLRRFEHHRERTVAALGVGLKTRYNRLRDHGQAREGAGDNARPGG